VSVICPTRTLTEKVSTLPVVVCMLSNGLRPVSESSSSAETTFLPISRATTPTHLLGESPLPISEETLVILTSSSPKTSTSSPTLSAVIGQEPTLSGTLPATLVRLNHVLPRLVTLLVPTTFSTRVPPSARPTGRYHTSSTTIPLLRRSIEQVSNEPVLSGNTTRGVSYFSDPSRHCPIFLDLYALLSIYFTITCLPTYLPTFPYYFYPVYNPDLLKYAPRQRRVLVTIRLY